VTGLTNVPMRNFEIELIKRVRNNLSISFNQVIDCSLQNNFQHALAKLVTQNEHGHLYSFDLDLKKCGLSFTNCYAMFSNQSKILISKQHKDFPLLALVLSEEIDVFCDQNLLGKILKI